MRSRSPFPELAGGCRRNGFTLIEVMITLLVMAILATSLAIPLAAQLQMRRLDEARRQLEQAEEALLGFAVTHGRLPCPATLASRGLESFAPGGHASNGECATFHAGYLPAASLGLAPVDSEGFARDPWGAPRNRIRYAVHGGTAPNGVTRPLTRASGMQSATLAGLGAAPAYLFICSTGLHVHAGGCGPAVHQLTRRAAFVLFSAGPNAGEAPRPGGDEARNADGDAVFVAREWSTAPGSEYDDVVHWAAIHKVVSRMVAAGRLP